MLEKGTVVFGSWTVEGEIGSGAFGTVYKIKKEEFGKVFYAAMKVLHIPQDKEEHKRLRSEGMDDASISTYYSQIAQDFVKEIELLSSLDGITNIVDYKDHVIEPNADMGYTVYIKMQLLIPVSNKLVNPDGSVRFMSAEEVLKLGKDMCSALEVCESKRIIHRDIKIDNIFVSEGGDYKLGDFGIARQLEATQGEMSKKGTVLYMAPEVFRGENYDKTVDIYSLGVVLYRLFNKNRAPFFPNYPDPIKFPDKEVANARRLKGDVFPDIVGISAELNAVLKKACAFNASDRYQSASEFKAALEGVVIAPATSAAVSPIVENTINDEKTESAFAPAPVAAPVVAPAMEITADEATVGVFGTAPVPPAAPAAPVPPTVPVTPVRPAAPVAPPKPSNPTMANKATVGTYNATPVPPVAPVAPTMPVAPVTAYQPMSPAIGVGTSPEASKKKTKLLIIIIAILVALALGVALIIGLGSINDSDSGYYYSGDAAADYDSGSPDGYYKVFYVYDESGNFVGQYSEDELYYEFDSASRDEIDSCEPNEEIYLNDDGYDFYAEFIGYGDEYGYMYDFDDVNY